MNNTSTVRNILVLGARGQLGMHLASTLEPLGNVTPLGRAECDIGDKASVAATIGRHMPRIVLNAAAYTDVDKAESDEQGAYRVNATGPFNLAEECSRIGATLIHYSTDYVYDGGGSHEHTEAEPTRPINAYGRTKLAGEVAISSAMGRHIILRISWLYGRHGRNFTKTILELAQTGRQLTVVDDQFGAPTPASLVADFSSLIVQRALTDQLTEYGIYNFCPRGHVSWHEFARTIVDLAWACNFNLKVRSDSIAKTSSANLTRPAARPLNSRLSTRKLSEAFGFTLPHWKDALARNLPTILSSLKQ